MPGDPGQKLPGRIVEDPDLARRRGVPGILLAELPEQIIRKIPLPRFLSDGFFCERSRRERSCLEKTAGI